MAINQVYKDGVFKTATQIFDDTGSITVEEGAGIAVTGGQAFRISDGPWTFKIDGVVQSDSYTILLEDKNIAAPIKNGKITVGSEGTVFSSGIVGAITSEQVVDIVNSGHIEGAKIGIVIMDDTVLSSSKTISITNNAGGLIRGGSDAISAFNLTHTLILKNAGEIDGLVHWQNGIALTNSGTITGKVSCDNPVGTFAGVVTNSGTIDGDLGLSDGADTVKNTGLVTGTITLFAGKNSMTNSGIIDGDVLGGAGDDTMANTGRVDNVSLGNGSNTLTNGGSILFSATLGVGSDTVINTGSIADDLALGDGGNKGTNGGTIGGDFTALGGADVLKNTGHVRGLLDAGGGNDTVSNSGTIDGDLNLGAGVDKLTNSGTIGGFLNGGDGIDTVINTGKIGGTIDLGKDNDSFTGGNAAERIIDGLGDDTYKMGGGNDTVTSGGEGIDFYDGGAGQDKFIASIVGLGVNINLDTKDVVLNGTTYAASSVAPAGSGNSTIKNFESITGTAISDTLIGGAAAETLNGSDGLDVIVGGGGADLLRGGAEIDTFFYLKTSDSGLTRATRDQILDFEGAGIGGGDMINLKAIDADTKTAGINEDFTVLLRDVAFGKQAGELRVLTDGLDAILQGDVNGDGKADFSILVIGGAALDGGDLIG